LNLSVLAEDALTTGNFRWTASPPLFSPAQRPDDPCCSVKDPTVVFHEGRWHLFCTIRSQKRTHQIEYCSFTDWKDADKAPRHLLNSINDEYYCAPQVFYFTPHKKWYLVFQAANKARGILYGPSYSTTENIADPASWSKFEPFYEKKPDNLKGWIDFWVICDATRAHLFFTSNDGRMWRAETKLADFPKGFGKPEVVLQGDIFEASHTYKIKDKEQYLTVIEAQAGIRYYKAYLADQLDGKWRPLADTLQHPFAAKANVKDSADHWTDSISHGEFLRDGNDEHLTIDPAHLRFLFQGVLQKDMAGKKYGEIPWRLGILEAQ
jgi:hypothetical protein